jgi:hypothetical protein
VSELGWSNEPSAVERGAYALAGTFRCHAYLCAGAAVFIGVGMAIGNSYISPIERVLVFGVFGVFGVFAAAGLVVTALLLFFGYVLAPLGPYPQSVRTFPRAGGGQRLTLASGGSSVGAGAGTVGIVRTD